MKPFSKQTEVQKDKYVQEMKVFEKWMATHKFQVFLSWGTLLGCIREGDFIDTDTDFDMGSYIGDSNCAIADRTFTRFNYYLKEHNLYEKKITKSQVKIWTPNRLIFIDTWNAWTENGKLHLGYDWHGISEASDLIPFRKAKLRGVEFNVPNKSESLLSQWFGDWKTPRPPTDPLAKCNLKSPHVKDKLQTRGQYYRKIGKL